MTIGPSPFSSYEKQLERDIRVLTQDAPKLDYSERGIRLFDLDWERERKLRKYRNEAALRANMRAVLKQPPLRRGRN